jgi:ferredoxin-NADP reductase
MVCGAQGFVRDVWQGLTARGVAPENITTETFFES